MSRSKLPSKPPWVRARVVKACGSLSSTQKLIWLEHYGLMNKGKGATISASGLGRRLSLSRITVERARQELVRCGLLKKRDRGVGRTDEWFCQLPADCRPQGTRITDDDAERYAELLDAHIRRSLPGSSPRVTDNVERYAEQLDAHIGSLPGSSPTGRGRFASWNLTHR